MEAALLTFFILSSTAVHSATFWSTRSIVEWNDVVVAREGTFATLVCIDKTATGVVSVNWMVKPPGTHQWKLVLSANEKKEFSGGASKDSMQLTDHNFQHSGIFSLMFRSQMEDGGVYKCLVKQRQKVLVERRIILAVLTVTVVPAGRVPQHSTLRLIASAQPDIAVNKITWAAPGDISMKTETKANFGTITKLPQVQNSDDGAYVCMVHPRGNSSNPLFAFNVDVAVDADKVASFTNITHGQTINTAVKAQSSFLLTCPDLQGDYVNLYWRPPGTTVQNNVKLVHQYDRWRGFTLMTERSKRLQLAGPPYNAQTGSFSFLLTPGIKDGGLYICEVYYNDNVFSQWTILSVVKESVGVTNPSLLPFLSTLLLLVPLVAVAVGALLWRQRHSSDRGIEQSLSVYSGEIENIYENPEDMRQAPPQGSVYMDLKPRGEDDVYKELERYEQCQS